MVFIIDLLIKRKSTTNLRIAAVICKVTDTVLKNIQQVVDNIHLRV